MSKDTELFVYREVFGRVVAIFISSHKLLIFVRAEPSAG